ncbi:MAG: glycerol-3-phosphate acyltransferase [Desulfobacterales bacterium]|nr:glycerol-3-phosphate acyltransferase [Desulfobacterales bacterium]
MWFLIFAIFAYCLGSINFAIFYFRLLKKEDPRTRYSGNPGVTNVYRQAGWASAALVLILDVGRAAAVAAAALALFSPPAVAWSGLALICGNRYPCFHQFKGGKGVANYLGFSAVFVPVAALASCLVWTAVFGLVRRPFIASFAMAAVLAGATIIKWQDFPLAVAGTAATLLFIIFNHRANIAELFTRA